MSNFQSASHRAGHMLASILQARRRYCSVQAPDLVVTSNWGAIEWALGARLARLPHVHTEDGFGPEERDRQLTRRVLIRRFGLRGSLVVLPSRTLERVATATWRLSSANLRFIPNGVDLARFADASPAYLPSGQGPVIGTVAALRPEKNLSRLIRAFAAIRARRTARLVIVGDGPERSELEQLARTEGIADDVVFAGHTTKPEAWYARFDVFALSSDTEQMPLSLLEAMAAGLPVVCTDVGDIKAMVSELNTEFVTPLLDSAFAEGLTRVLDGDYCALGVENRKKAEAVFDQAEMFAAHGRLLGL